jgi:hypothetical protein
VVGRRWRRPEGGAHQPVAMADWRRNCGLQRRSSGEEMAFFSGEFVVEKGSQRSSIGGVTAWAWHGRKGVATCNGERPMV